MQLFYRAAGEATAPAVLLLHGFPTSSFMFRELIPRLANDYRVIAPDLPGFGFTEVPIDRRYSKKRVFRPIGLPPTSRATTGPGIRLFARLLSIVGGTMHARVPHSIADATS